MIQKVHRDSEFLEEPHDYIGQPLSSMDRSLARIAFAPGVGLGLGDQFMCVPLVRSLCHLYPQATVDLFTEHPEFWQVIGEERVRVCASDSTTVLAATRNQNVGLAILGYYPDCLSAFRNALVPTLFCAGTNLADYRGFFAAFGTCHEIPLCATRQRVNEARRFTGLFEDFGLRCEELAPRRSVAARQPRAAGLCGARVMLHAGSAKHYKRWPEACWRNLAQLMAERGVEVVVSRGVSTEESRSAERIAAVDGRVELLPRLGLAPFLNSIADCDLVVSADTFLPHATQWIEGTLSYTLYGPTDPLRFCPWGSRHHFGRLDAKPADVAGAVDTLLRAQAVGPEAVSHDGGIALAHAAGILVNRVNGWTEADAPPQGLRWERWRSCADAYCEAIRPEFRAAFVGDDSIQRRLAKLLANDSWPLALDAIQSSPAFRSATMLVEYARHCEPLRSAAG